MNLTAKLAWEYRWSWVAMFVLTAASALVLIVCSHVALANDIITAETGNPSLKIDFYISVLASLLIVQTIAVLCLESQSRDLAIIKTCGASRRSVRRTLLGEILVVTLAGYGLGVLISLFVIEPYTTWAMWVSANIAGRSFGLHASAFISAGVALTVAVWLGSRATIRRVSRQNVVNALQGETPVHRRKRVLGRVFGWLAIVINVLLVIISLNAGNIVGFVQDMLAQGGASGSEVDQMVASAQGGVILMPPMLFVLGAMIIFGAFAPTLYGIVLRITARFLPQHSPGWLEVGLKQAAWNASKYYGSLTPLVVFVLAVVMIFATVEGSVGPIQTLYAQHGIDASMLSGTNYSAIVMLIGPALFIAFVGSIANMMMSGRGRIYVNKLTGILGTSRRELLLQALTETTSYVYVAAVLGLITLLCSSVLVWAAGNSVTRVQHPLVVAWPSYFLALLFIFVVVSIPAIASVVRSRKIPSKQVLESFGE